MNYKVHYNGWISGRPAPWTVSLFFKFCHVQGCSFAQIKANLPKQEKFEKEFLH